MTHDDLRAIAAAVTDLMAALEASVAAAKEGPHPAPATEGQHPPEGELIPMTSATLQAILDRYEETGELPTDEQMQQQVTLPAMCLRLEHSGIQLATVQDKETGDWCVASPTGFVRVGGQADLAGLAMMLAEQVDDEGLREQVSMMWR